MGLPSLPSLYTDIGHLQDWRFISFHGANVWVSSWQRYLHASSEWAPVFGLTAAFAAASMIPTSGVLREVSDNTQATTKNGEGVEVPGLKSES